MRNYPMPVGNPTLIENNSSKIESIIKDTDKYSFVDVDVTAPDNLNIPLLLTRYKGTNGGTRSIAPLGNWKGVYTSIEILRGLELGYTFKFNKAVFFESKILFKDM